MPHNNDVQGMSYYSTYKNKLLIRIATVLALIGLVSFICVFAQKDNAWKESNDNVQAKHQVENKHTVILKKHG